MITLLIKLLKLLVTNKVAYAINEITYENEKFYKIEKILITDIYLSYSKPLYMVADLKTNEDWGDTIEHVYFNKNRASKELLKLCNL